MRKDDLALLTVDNARTVFGDEYEEHVASGELRIVTMDGVDYALGADVKYLVSQQDPRQAAKQVPRFNGASADDSADDSPSNLARNVPRL